MKKIMFMIESMVVGGAEKVLIDLVNNLDKTKYDITVISMFRYSIYDDYKHNFSELFKEHIKVKYLIDNSSKLKYKLFNLLNNHLPKDKIYNFFIREDYDVEIAFYEGFPTDFLSYSTNKKSKKIAWLHTDSNNAFGHYNKQQIDNMEDMYSKFDNIIAVSKSVCNSFNRIFQMEDRVIVKYNVIETDNIISKSKQPIESELINENFKLVTVGRLIPVKGYERLLKIVKMLVNDGFKFELWIIGDGSEKENLYKYVEQNKLQGIVKFLGFKDNPYKYIRKCNLFVCSSIAEGFSTVVTESLILNKPIVTTNCSGMEELLGSYECGIITENSDIGLYEGLKSVLENNKKLELLNSNIVNRSKMFSTKKLTNEIQNIF